MPLLALLELLADPEAPTCRPRSAPGGRRPPGRLAGRRSSSPALRAAAASPTSGSGAGFPGLPLALALPDARVLLVESQRRKCAFLERAVDGARPDATPRWLRARRGAAPRRDAATSSPPARWRRCRSCASTPRRCCAQGGVAGGVEGRASTRPRTPTACAAAAALGLEREEVRAVSRTRARERRTLHVLRKIAPTPPGYPPAARHGRASARSERPRRAEAAPRRARSAAPRR